MNGRNLNNSKTRKKQTGAFAVELAVVAPLIAMILVFATDMIGKQSIKGRLQVAAYSAVSVLKEHTELYEGRGTKISNDITQLINIVQSSMARTMTGFEHKKMGYFVERFEAGENEEFSDNNVACEPEKPLSEMTDLHITTSSGVPVTLYQVTLCYQDGNGFGSLVGADYSRVKSNAIMVER